MRFGPILAVICALSAVLTPLVATAITFNEATDGDLSGQIFQLQPGENRIAGGSTVSPVVDSDNFNISIANGLFLSDARLEVLSFSFAGEIISFSVSSSIFQIFPDRVVFASGGAAFIEDTVVVANSGTINMLEDGEIAPGLYTIDLSGASNTNGPLSFNYEFIFTVGPVPFTEIPLPPSMLLMLAGLATLAAARRRWPATQS